MSDAWQTLLTAWEWNPLVLAACAGAVVIATICDRRIRASSGCGMRRGYFVAAVSVVLLALVSPVNTLANGVLFSAHMVQHILVLLVAPGLLVLSLPRGRLARVRGGKSAARRAFPAIGWAGGVGSMWFWHVPAFCDAAATSGGVHAAQTLSLLALGAAFWWPILAPRESDRLLPGPGVAYLFTACLACTALGILLTLTPVEVCPVFRAPLAAPGWSWLRERVSAEADRQTGGLLMWIPMCLVYVGAIMFELGRWFRPAPARKGLPS
jgi:cytochrome c oxidase assembly factor CtaG